MRSESSEAHRGLFARALPRESHTALGRARGADAWVNEPDFDSFLLCSLFTVLEGETSVDEVPRKRGKCGFAPRDLEVRSCFARGVVRCANAWFWQTGDGGLTQHIRKEHANNMSCIFT
jgi:hypothetical protein